MNSENKLIKSLTTKLYKIELLQTPSDLYIVQYDSARQGELQLSEMIRDYKTASYLFDLKADELDGN